MGLRRKRKSDQEMSELGKLSTGQMESIFASLVESSEDAIISKNLQSIVQLWNRGAERILDIRLRK